MINMALLSELWSLLTAGNVLLLLLFLLLLHHLVEFYEFRGMPPGPRFYSIPLFGNFLSFDSGAGKSLYESTQSLMRKYGEVFSLRLGAFNVVVAASGDSVKEMLVKRSEDYAGRPPFHTYDIMTLGRKDIGFSDCGPAFKLYRSLFVKTMRYYLRDDTLIEGRIYDQAKHILQYIDEKEGKPFDPTYILASSVGNVISEMIFGKRFNSSHPEFARLLELNTATFRDVRRNKNCAFYDFFPIMKWLPIKEYKWKKGLSDSIFEILRKEMKEAEKSFDPSAPVRDFMGGFIKARNEAVAENEQEKLALMTDDYVLATLEDMFLAGVEPTSSTLLWFIAYLANYPDYQTKIQQELDDVVSRDTFPCAADRHYLPLLEAFIMESLFKAQRLGNVGHMGIPHYTIIDTSLAGYHIPKNTIVFPNLEALHLDPKCWENPEEFNPHRHIGADGKLITDQGNLLPFGAGRRGCPGESIAKLEIVLFLSIILQSYSFLPGEGQETPLLKGRCGLLNKKPFPYVVSAIKR